MQPQTLKAASGPPARYNTKSEHEANVKPGKNVFDFKLESKPAAK